MDELTQGLNIAHEAMSSAIAKSVLMLKSPELSLADLDDLRQLSY